MEVYKVKYFMSRYNDNNIFRKIMTTVPLVFLIGADEKTEEATPK